VGYLRKEFIPSQIYSTFLIITITCIEHKRVKNDKCKSLYAKTKILNLWCWMVYGRYRRKCDFYTYVCGKQRPRKSVASMFRDVRQRALISCYFWWWNKFMNGLLWWSICPFLRRQHDWCRLLRTVVHSLHSLGWTRIELEENILEIIFNIYFAVYLFQWVLFYLSITVMKLIK